MSSAFPIPATAPVPLATSDLTPAWLNAALRSAPALAGRKATNVEARPLAESAVSRVFRLDVAWADDLGPASLIAKLPAATAEGRAGPFARRMTRREQRFYDVLAPRSPIHVPAAHALLGDDDTGRALLLEDLAGSDFRMPPAAVGLTPTTAAILIEAIAPFHARWWQGPRQAELGQPDWLYDYATRGLDIDDTALLPTYWQALCATGLVPEAAQPRGARISRDIDALTERFLALPTTLIHGDLHLENVCLRTELDRLDRPPDAGDAAFIDWQHTARGPATYDLAKLLATGLEATDLSQHLPSLLTRYHAALTAGGVHYPLPALHQDFALALHIVVATDIGDGNAPTTAAQTGHLSPWTRRLLANLATLPPR